MNEMTTAFRRTSKGATKAHELKQLMDDLLRFQVDIEKALVYSEGSHTFDDVVGLIVTGRLHFYPLENSFLIMEVVRFPQYKVYHMFLAGGSLREIISMQETIRANAKELDCKYGTMNGRKGWQRVLEKQGWKYSHIHMQLEV